MTAPLVVIEGFDSGYPSACLTDWIQGQVSFQTGRNSGQSMLANGYAAGNDYARRMFTSTNNEISLGIAVRIQDQSSSAYQFFSVLDSGGSHLLDIYAGSVAWLIYHYTGGTTQSAYQWNVVPSANTWGYMELKFLYGSSGYIEARWNGVSVGSRTGVNTRTNALSGVIGGVAFGNPSGSLTPYFDDMWIESGAGADFRGDRRVISILPTGDAGIGWTSSTGANHWGEIDDMVYTTYVSTPAGSGAMDTYTFGDLPVGTFNIDAVAVKAMAQSDYAPANIAMHRGGTVGQSRQVTTSSKVTHQVFETDSSNAPWNTASVNASTFGIVATP